MLKLGVGKDVDLLHVSVPPHSPGRAPAGPKCAVLESAAASLLRPACRPRSFRAVRTLQVPSVACSTCRVLRRTLGLIGVHWQGQFIELVPWQGTVLW